MALSPGHRLGPYEILATLGVGGMGQVYSAADTRLHRTVAIKVVSHERVADNERKRRFLQEARAASALNHPNIVTLHDMASDGGIDYLVMEYIPGKSLDQLINRKALPLVEAVGYARQIANALAAAHAAGIIHRDVKPANVIITPDSQVKVLDFGLAKLRDCAPGVEGETQTIESALTERGTVLGTVAYMSPEQAGARPIDHRTDVFSLGVVLYEMITGQRPFRGKSAVETMNAIINDPAPLLDVQRPEVNDILDKALAKDLKNRYQHAGDLALDLDRCLRKPVTVPPRLERFRFLTSGIIVMLLLAVPGAWWLGHSGSSSTNGNPLADAKFTRFTDFEGTERDAAISPDGKFVAFISDRDGPLDVWVSQVGTGRFENRTQGKVPDLDSLLRVVGFSGDGTEIWLHDYYPKNPLLRMPLMGGPVRIFLSKSPAKTAPINVAWSPDGTRLVYHTSDDGDPMFMTDLTGGNPSQIFVNQSSDIHNHYPAWSLDGHWIYFVRGTPTTGEMDLWRVSPDGKTAEQLTHHKSAVSYPAPAGERTVFYVAQDQDGSGPWMWALDTERKITRRVSFGLEKYVSVAATADGRRLVATVANPSAALYSVPILDHVAQERDVKPFALPTVRALAPRFRGPSLFYLSSQGTGDGLWRYQDGQVLEIWKGSDGALLEPVAVSSDGRRLAFVLRRDGKRQMHLTTAEGSDLQAIDKDLDIRGAADWSPDGKWIVAGGVNPSGAGLFKIPVDGGAPVRLYEGSSSNPVWSPDGDLIVFTGANVSAVAPLLAVHPDGSKFDLPRIEVRREGERVRFLPNGKALVFMQGLQARQDFWLLNLATGKTRTLAQLSNPAAMLSFDITADGKQIVFDRLKENSDIVLIDLPK
jgi:serine/threonine protein kinase